MPRRRTVALTVALYLAAHPVGAAEPQHWLIDRAFPGDVARVGYSTCSDPEIWEECVELAVGCGEGEGWIEIYDGAAIARRLLEAADWPDAKMTLSAGGTSSDVGVTAIEAAGDDLNGGWVVTLKGFEMSDAFQLIVDQPGKPVSVTVAGKILDLTPRTEDRAKFSHMAEACRGAV